MKYIYKVIAHDLFQKMIVLSVFLVPLFYWPNKEPRLMKFICFQTISTILLCVSFMFTPKRTIDNPWPALFLILGFANLFTHGMSDFVNVGVGFIMPAVVCVYVIGNHLQNDFVPVVKKAIVLMCLVNCVLYITECMGINTVFILHKANGWERPCGFMCYPASLALLCAVSLVFIWKLSRDCQWIALTSIPIAWCLWSTHEFSVFLGIFLAVFVPFLRGIWKLAPFIAVGVFACFTCHASLLNCCPITNKIALRMKYLYPVIQNVWARSLDGWGVGMYNRLPDSFFGFPRGNWSEMHCEPLDLFFCMGLTGVACVVMWIKHSVQKMNMEFKMIFIVFGVTACFQSPLHFADTLFLGALLIALHEVERAESS